MELLDTHMYVRSHFPYIGPELIGSNKIQSKSFYEIHGYSYEINLNKKITPEIRELFNSRSHWLNQNVIIRLYSLLNKYDFVGDEESKIKIDNTSPGSQEVDFVRRLRNIFGHSSGKYNSNRSDHRKLRKELIEYFDIQLSNREFPLSINDVIVPLFEGCKKYIEAKY